MKKIVTISFLTLTISFLILIIFTIYIAYILWKNNLPKSSEQWNALLYEKAYEINKNLPIILNENMIYEKVISWPGKRIIFITSYNKTKLELEKIAKLLEEKWEIDIEEGLEKDKKNLINNVCNNNEFKFYLENNVKLSYKYLDIEWKLLYDFNISSKECWVNNRDTIRTRRWIHE